MKPQIAISIVTYRTDLDQLAGCLESVLGITLPFACWVVDNASQPQVRQCCERMAVRLPSWGRLEYVPQSNIGYGRAHNIAMSCSLTLPSCRYHIVANPDIAFAPGTVERLAAFLDKNQRAGAAMPRIVYPDGTPQYLGKLLPSPGHLFARRFLPALAARYDSVYSLRCADYTRVFECPSLSGCFVMIRTEALRQAGLFDERYFLYCEDLDLIRRVGECYETYCCPFSEVVHVYHKGSYSSTKLLIHHVCSSIKYFNKWGWFFDAHRTRINRQTLDRIQAMPAMPCKAAQTQPFFDPLNSHDPS